MNYALQRTISNYEPDQDWVRSEIYHAMKMVEWNFCRVNLSLLPIKFHYFFFFGGMGGVMPFMPVLAKGLGISAMAVGIAFTVTPFCVLFSKPLFGYITDFFQNIKLVVFLLVCVTSLSYISVIFLPTIDDTKWIRVKIQCKSLENSMYLLSSQYDGTCLRGSLTTELNGELSFVPCYANTSQVYSGKVSLENLMNESHLIAFESNVSMRLKFAPDSNLSCDCIKDNSSVFSSAKINSCFVEEDNKSVYKTYQFWVFTLLAVISGTGAATVFCLSDTACYEVLGERSDLYGKQRLWATISWGIATLVAGFLNDLATGDSNVANFSPGFYLMLALVTVDLLLLLKIKLTKANLSLHICQDIGKIFSSTETIAFACAVYIIGALTGLLWNYEFWFLQDLGATQTLMGLCIAVQCLVAEVPFFFFSGWLIKIFGHFYCIIGTFAAFAVRLGLYYVLEDPWLVLPIEALHGITFGVFYASMTGYASDSSPPGTEATMMGILGGLYEGLGVATGSLLGGVGFDKLGGRQTFLIAAAVSMFSLLILSMVLFVLKKHSFKNGTSS
ncbi:Major facilitator superfamily domain-containing protein 6-B [Araneus ventricosus]|uniref:Major facilitator superfamily domain-containing protein 6-B n=1 Tax=Araneus ventricosus TaxID=182803 RepID=A0A4Y2CJE6_ARAVE|nr:Major facilitator superfamily domain-containing protein 6-B [Araneus ventricosus]